jgi:isoquinoline 1-oxidoreductase alpha subunit
VFDRYIEITSQRYIYRGVALSAGRPEGSPLHSQVVLFFGTMPTSFVLNGKSTTLDADPTMPLLWALREIAGLTGTKFGCGMALCGACTVQLEGRAVRSCVLPLAAVAGKQITTIEGLQSKPAKAVQAAWIKRQVPQCGYCQSGQIMSATALLESNPTPSDADIDAAMSGNICRCATYRRIRAAIHDAAEALKV